MTDPPPGAPSETSHFGPDELDDHAVEAGCDEPGDKAEFGLALSGGGYRAMLFHLGALTRLNELGLLGKIGRFSGVSGGTFAAAMLAVAWNDLEWEDGRATNFDALVGEPILALSRAHVDAVVIPIGVIPPLRSAHLFAHWLDWRFFHGKRLADLPDDPIFIFNAMHFATGVGWRFRKRYMGTYRLGLICKPDVALSSAVAASSAFPPFMGSYKLRTDPAAYTRTRGADLFDDPDVGPKLKSESLLFDGGAYDNLAVQPLLKRCETLLVSDAGGNLNVDTKTWRYRFWGIQTKRILDAQIDQGRDLRRAALVQGTKDGHYKLAIWRTLTDPARFKVAPVVDVPLAWRNHLASVSTRMWPPNPIDRQALVAWGYLAADLPLRAFIAPGLPPDHSRVPFRFDFRQPPPGKKQVAAGTSALDDASG